MEAFYWMFKQKDFKKHYTFLCIGIILFSIISFATSLISTFITRTSLLTYLIFIVPSLFIILTALFFPLGYFWELTENIINRSFDIKTNQIYDGKIKEVYTIELPEINISKFIWRGFTSFIANIIIFIPYIALIYMTFNNETLFDPSILAFLLSIMFYFILPALYWNYAKRNSIFSMLNIFSAVYLIGNYTFRYIKYIILFLITLAINVFIDYLFSKALILEQSFNFTNIAIIISYILFTLIKTSYFIYVFAYILGTIVPTKEC